MAMTRALVSVIFLAFTAFACASATSTTAAEDGGDTSDALSAEDTLPEVEPPPAPTPADCRPNLAPFPARPEPREPATLPWLRVEGTRVVDEDGDPVMLRGINFGSWLMMETWLAGIGVKGEKELFDEIPVKAAEHGVAALIERARLVNFLEWTFYTRPRWVCLQEWRVESYALVEPAQRAGLDAFWAWFDAEPWIFEERSLWRWLEGRFGYARSQELRAAFLDNYISELDVERVAALGLNLIRVPVWYQALETDIEGENGFVMDGWERLDQLVSWARKHRVYVMLDLHGAPGGQSVWWHQGLENGGFLWETPACVDKTVRLWQAIASYFRDEPHVAVYDFLNEPNGAPDRESYAAVHDAIYRAVREVDDRHIVMAEDGFLGGEDIASPAEMGWDNAMMAWHHYPGGDSAAAHAHLMDEELLGLGEFWARFDCPLFSGEFNVYNPTAFNATDDPDDRWEPEAMRAVLTRMNERGIHWAPWSWKYFASPSLWGVYHPGVAGGARIDVRDASFEEIRAAFEGLHSENFVIDDVYGQVLREAADEPVNPLNLGALPD